MHHSIPIINTNNQFSIAPFITNQFSNAPYFNTPTFDTTFYNQQINPQTNPTPFIFTEEVRNCLHNALTRHHKEDTMEAVCNLIRKTSSRVGLATNLLQVMFLREELKDTWHDTRTTDCPYNPLNEEIISLMKEIVFLCHPPEVGLTREQIWKKEINPKIIQRCRSF